MSKWYDDSVFYHMYPLGMTGAPRENRKTEPVHRFEELMLWIPHMRAMGFTAVYIGPLFESSTHGYDTRDYKLVDRRLGDNDDFKRFVRLCHESGIRVVVDGVFNHTGREFFAFRDIQENREVSPYKNWYRGVNFGWGSPLGDSFSYEAWQGHMELPCLNLQEPAVKSYLLEVIRFWTDEFAIDGIRLDCANVLDFQFMRDMRRATEGMKEDFWLMGEVIHGDYARWVNRDTLHSVTNYELHKSIYSGLNDHNFFEIAHNVRRLEAIGRQLYTFLDNHDEDRIASKLKKREHLPLAYLLLMTLPGIPSVYYGGEWAVEGRRTKTSDEALRPRIDIRQITEPEGGDTAENSPGFTAYIKSLAHIHRDQAPLHQGIYKELLLTNRQYAFARMGEGCAVITAANSDDGEAFLSVPLPINGRNIRDLITGDVYQAKNGRIELQLKGNHGVVLKITEE